MEAPTKESTHAYSALAAEAARWHVRMQEPTAQDKSDFAQWLKISAQHVEAYLRLSATLQAFDDYLATVQDPHDPVEDPTAQLSDMLEDLIEDWAPARELYAHCSRPVMLMFVTKSIACRSAMNLLQKTFIQTLQNKPLVTQGDRRTVILKLHETASRMLHTYLETPAVLGSIPKGEESTPSLRAPIPSWYDPPKLSSSVKALKRFLSDGSGTDVLIRFYVEGKSDAVICSELGITRHGFKESLWTSRRLFGEILREQRVDLEVPEQNEYSESIDAAYYVANALVGSRQRDFELEMIENPAFDREVTVWHTIKTDLRREREENALHETQ